jgi:hypothetical protein
MMLQLSMKHLFQKKLTYKSFDLKFKKSFS